MIRSLQKNVWAWAICLAVALATGVWSDCLSAGESATAPVTAADEELRCLLLYMEHVDQQARKAVIQAGMTTGELMKMMLAVDVPNANRMKKIVATYGWPGKSLVGDDGAAAAWLVVQHATHDLPFMERCVALLKAAVEQGEASPKHLAYLSDRARVHQGKSQIYGTQFKLVGPEQLLVADPIEDEAHVDERRATLGLSTMAEQERAIRATYLLRSPVH